MRILSIDQDPDTLKAVSLTLRFLWPEVALETATTGMAGVEKAESLSPDAIILDLDLPDIDGLEVLRQLRLFSDVPIIVLTARDQEIDKVRSLEIGADDYVAKPFSPLELLARVKATLRRAGVLNPEVVDLPPYVVGNLTINFATREISRDGESLHLTPIEYKLLQVLVRNSGRVVTHDSIRRWVWGGAEYVDSSTVKKNISQLRKKLGDTPEFGALIVNERGVGYKFVKPVSDMT